MPPRSKKTDTPAEPCIECTPPGGIHPEATAFACVHGSWTLTPAEPEPDTE